MERTSISRYPAVSYCLILLILFSFCSASASGTESSNESRITIAPLNPAFIQYQEEMSENSNLLSPSSHISSYSDTDILDTGTFSHDPEPFRPAGLIPSPVDLSHLSPVDLEYLTADEEVSLMSTELSGSEVYPSRYDLRDTGGVTAVRDQGSAGSCWAHSTLSSLESYLLYSRSETWDLSENNVKNMLVSSYQDGFDRYTHDEGGYDLSTAAYMARWSGPVLETDDPYNPSSGISPGDQVIVKHVQDIFMLPGFNGSDTLYKWMITNYGGISIAFYYDNNYYDPVNSSFYYSGEVQLANHAVTLVGWDDAYSRYNFVPAAPGDGAFIVKNSWGDKWGENGYFYISYYDTVMGNNEGIDGLDTKPYIGNFMFTAEDVSNYDRIYQYDPLGWTACAGYGNITAYGANVFTAAANGTLEAVSFYTVDSNSLYNVSIYLDPEDGPVNVSGPVSIKNGSIPFAGYHTIDLDSSVPLLAGQNFSVVVAFTTPQYTYPLAIEKQVPDYSSNAYASPGQSYMSSDGSTWTDISACGENVCIKAFTGEEREPQAAFVAGTKYVRVNETVDFHDASLFSPEVWTWDFGDGVTSTQQDPTHAYTTPGVYNVSLNASNPYGSNVSLRSSFIHVLEPTIVVNSSGCGDFTTIGEALLAASEGSSIIVEPGTYTESLHITSDNVSLVSSTGDPADVSIISPYPSGSAIEIWADNTTISGVNVSGSHMGIVVGISRGCNISNCFVYGNSYGIYLYNSEETHISSTILTDNVHGIMLRDSRNNLIYNNYFNNSDNVIFQGESSNRWNTTATEGINIINGTRLGGNFWAGPDGAGWSQVNPSTGNGFCQQYEITNDGYNTDHLPLTSNGEQPAEPASGNPHRSGNDGVRVRISSSDEPSSNIAAVDSDIRFIGRDTDVRYVFTDRSTPVTDISFRSEVTQGYVMASVSLLNELPDGVPEPSSTRAYQAMDIVLGEGAFSSSGAGEARIGFAVPKEWIAATGADKYAVHMQHFYNGAWNRLPTTMTDEDGEYVYFEAITTGFSPFLVCADAADLGIELKEVNGPDSIADDKAGATDENTGSRDIAGSWKDTIIRTLPGLVLAGIVSIAYWIKGSSKGKN